MNKVITINLNGNAYQVEERGYDLLCEYLDGAESQLKDNPDRAEIVSDLEQAIADKCRNFLGPQKTIVTSAEIEQIIQAMGPVDSDGSEAEPSSKANAGSSQSEQKQEAGGGAKSGSRIPKRFYRIREGKQIEGVCTGLAALSGIDVSILRVICIVLAVVSGGIFGLVYLGVVIAVPYAETSEEHAAAYGTDFNAQDFINQAKEHYSEFKKEGEEWKQRANEKKHEWQRSWRRSIRNQRAWWGPRPVPPPPIVGGMFPIFGVLVGVLTLICVLAVVSVINTHAIFGWPLPLRFPVWVAIVILFVLLNVVTGPFKYMRNSHYYGHPAGAVAASFAAFAWLALLIFLGWFAYNHSIEVHNFIQNLPNVWDEITNR